MENQNPTHSLLNQSIIASDDIVGLNSLVNYLVMTYFAHFFGICLVRARNDSFYHTAPLPTILLVIQNNDDFEKALGVAVNMGCQVGIDIVKST